MLLDLIGMRIPDAERMLKEQGREVKVIRLSSDKQKEFDHWLVIRARELNGAVELIAGNFKLKIIKD